MVICSFFYRRPVVRPEGLHADIGMLSRHGDTDPDFEQAQRGLKMKLSQVQFCHQIGPRSQRGLFYDNIRLIF